MIRTLFSKAVGRLSDAVFFKRFAGPSTDTKPTANVAMGSEFIETDTGKKYRFNESTGQWVEDATVE